ncbi:Sodium- and chloride-dependent glycine transporter 2-like protein [Dinothrombium tinctorium]|nr:Sodium- and chloride-dependent glycine transporter 2-like protein [Dinothrombium tinctorium]
MVGIGNVYRFPYLVFKNGGGAFLIPYLFFTFIMAIPIILMEATIGQYSKRGPVECFGNMVPIFKGVGYAAVLTSAILCTCFNMLIAWTMFYLGEVFNHKWTSCSNDYNTDKCITIENVARKVNRTDLKLSTEEFFDYYLLNKSNSMYEWSWPQRGLTIALFITTVIVVLALCQGVKSSGKVVYFTALFPYVMLILLFFRGIFLEGALEGIRFYVQPDISKLTDISIWMQALVALFYSLGVGMGCMIVYGSYNRFHNNLVRDAVLVVFGDVFTSMLSGFVVFSMIGYVANVVKKPVQEVVQNGRGLAFTVILSGLSTLPGALFWNACFFFGLFTLGIDSQFAFVETVTTYFYDRGIVAGNGPKHILVSTLCGVALFMTSLPFATRPGIYLFDMYEIYGAGVPVMTIAIFECILIGYVYGRASNFPRNALKELIEDSFNSTGRIFNTDAPWFAFFWPWIIAVSPVCCIPIGIVQYLRKNRRQPFSKIIHTGMRSTTRYHRNALKSGEFKTNK